jgi:hypothetical protein
LQQKYSNINSSQITTLQRTETELPKENSTNNIYNSLEKSQELDTNSPVTLSPLMVDFGTCYVGWSKERIILVTNTSDSSLSMSVSITQDNSKHHNTFLIKPDSNLSNNTFTLNPKSTIPITVSNFIEFSL